ncbi:MAG: hypothetical protein AAGA95_05990 [Pseudomonadota bacterium]
MFRGQLLCVNLALTVRGPEVIAVVVQGDQLGAVCFGKLLRLIRCQLMGDGLGHSSSLPAVPEFDNGAQ